MNDNGLTNKREMFIENYLSNGNNGKRAAEDAGYAKGHAAETEASRLLRNAEIQERVRARVAEAGVQTNEVIGTLVSHMRADLADVYPEHPLLKRAKAAGISHWIRKLTIKEYFDKSKQATVTETSVELHNAQTAAKQLCAVMGLEVAAAKNPYDAARAAYERLILEHPGVNQTVIADRVAGVYGIEAELLNSTN
jgi:phage terminase small subunit